MTTAAPPLARRRVGRIAFPALACAALVAGIFGLCEVAARGWALDPHATELLHVFRGVASSTVVGLFTAWHVRRVPPALDVDHPPLPAEGTPQADQATRENAAWFVAMRWLASLTAVLVTFLATRGGGLLPEESFPRLMACAAALIATNVVFELVSARVVDVHRFLLVQALSDLLILTAMLHFSGGIENPLYPVYLFHVVLAAALVRPGPAYAVTAAASVLLLLLAVTEGFGLVERYPIALGFHRAPLRVGTATLAPIGMLARVASAILLFWVTAFFAVALRNRTRRREEQLLRSSAALRDSNRQLALVADSTGDALLLWNAPRAVGWCNGLARQERRCGVGGARGDCADTCVREPLVTSAFATGAPQEEERVEHRDDGVSRRLHARAVPLRDDRGETERVLLILRDVTATRAMEAEVLHATKMAVLGRVAAGMAHEIGNPLAAMTTRLALLEQDPSPDFVRESARVLGDQVGRITRLVQSVRRFGRPSTAARVPCGVEETAQEVIRMLRLDPRARNVRIEVDVERGLPQVEAVRDQLVQVFVNLALNALESMPQGGRLGIAASRSPIGVRVRFSDTGAGLSPQASANLFRPFFTTKAEGSGLGLFLSRHVVCELGGTIDAFNGSDGGATFEVQLPAASAGGDATPGAREGRWAHPS
ncbi:MAG: two-component system sensor histidine kinase NtrB [Myxococcota bacterium]